MARLRIHRTEGVAEKWAQYPMQILPHLEALRNLTLEAAENLPAVTEIVETLKWGEPSFLVKGGSTVRIDWKAKNPDFIALYFICTSGLVPVFKVLYGDTFQYEKDRALWFPVSEELPREPILDCLSLAFSYHRVKHLPLLGRG
ncbi:MAG: DUF1801 domain-containing protein [Bacteroidota bacterium]